jgi:diguanylate cyclase (GGDEF)-like protein
VRALAESNRVDSFDDDLRVRSVTLGVFLTFLVVVVVVAYGVATWERPHRSLIVGLGLAAAAVGAALPLLPIERVIRSRWCEAFFCTWSLVNVAFISVMAVLDGTDESPLALTYVMPLIFAASCYPLGLTLVVCVANVGACLTVGLSDGGDPDSALVLTGLLAAAAVMCALQARNHDRQREALRRISRTDPLTEVLNRRGFEERFDTSLRAAERSGEPLALLLLDLDGFKPVNDRDGHAAGDALLQWTAARIGACVRPDDVVGRIGGDEFAVLAPNANDKVANDIAARVADALEERIGVSIGVADHPSDGKSADDLHRRADERLYAAKRLRRNDPATFSVGVRRNLVHALHPIV